MSSSSVFLYVAGEYVDGSLPLEQQSDAYTSKIGGPAVSTKAHMQTYVIQEKENGERGEAVLWY